MIQKYGLIIVFFLGISACTWSSPQHPTKNNTPRPTTSAPAPGSTSSQTNVPDNANPNNIENFYVVNGQRFAVLKSSIGFYETGIASWYGDPFHGQKTSNGEVYNMHDMTAAHKHLPLPSHVEVTNDLNGRSVILRVNDRGPFVGDRVIDLSFAAAQALDVVQHGTAPVTIRGIDNLNLVEEQNRVASPDRPGFIQLASFSEFSNANNYHQKLLQNGFRNALVQKSRADNGATVFRIQLGPILSGNEYDHNVKKLANLGITKHMLIRE